MSDSRYLMPDNRRPISDFRYEIGRLEFSIGYWISDILYHFYNPLTLPPSRDRLFFKGELNLCHPVSGIRHRKSHISQPVSQISNPESRISNLVTRIPQLLHLIAVIHLERSQGPVYGIKKSCSVDGFSKETHRFHFCCLFFSFGIVIACYNNNGQKYLTIF